MRIVSLISSATEMLFALGLGAQVLAVSHECDWPPSANQLPRATRSRIDSAQSSQAIDEQVKQLLARGEPLYEIDEPLLRQLAPHLIITQAQCDVCAIRLADVLRLQSEAPELQHTRVLPLNPTSLEGVLADIARIGVATNTESAELIAGYRQRIATIVDRTASLTVAQRPRVLCIEWIEPLMPAGNWTPQLIEMAGGVSGLAVAGEHSRYSTWEEVAAFAPEIILVAPCGFDLPRTLSEAERLPRVPGWQQLPAVQHRRVFAIDGNALLNRSGPRLVESLELLAHLIQPQFFPNGPNLPPGYWQPIG
ncbi:cobalamin-binding protein [Anatilimnocola floriformis]|uniref:cobalamin-binding protein n=1 Tax=Anatilimnocola floriformis TaxID=2948575 RepID=UPI0020C33926|nr:cobalamin-binding protein [Anatilimnocola floriformis]